MKATLSAIPVLVLSIIYIKNVSGTEWFPNRISDIFWQLGIAPKPKFEISVVPASEEDVGRSDLEIESEITTAKAETAEANTEINPDYDVNTWTILRETSEIETTTSQPFVVKEPVIDTSVLPPEIAASENSSEHNATVFSKKSNVRLPDTILPLHYTLKLQPFVNGNLSIHGFMEVEIEVFKSTSELTLHAADIECIYHTAKVMPMDDKEGSEISIIQFTYDPDNKFFTALLERPMSAGKKYRYSIFYFAQLTQQPQGFFSTTYSNSDNIKRRLAVTIFQPTHARRAFPCFDEPAMKATFDIFLAREIHMTSISNMPLRNTTSIEGMDGWVLDQFETTPPMSTYLVVFIITELQYISTTIHNDLPIRVWARSEVLHEAKYALQLAANVCTFFEDYFNISYPLPKLDIVALPSSLPMAFEGWGTILNYGEKLVLYSENNSLATHKHQIGMILAHELAHQWFGNLVTPLWWTDLWLNEGFASYMENVGVAHVKAEWELEEHQVMKDLHSVLRMDSSLSSHPISIPVYHPDEIRKIFDSISYEKGSSIIRMMNHFLTEETFKKGITNFLNRHKFKGANQDNLWECLTEVGYEDNTLPKHLTIKTIMDTWTLQMGYPVINVVRNTAGTYATVSQERFLLTRNSPNDNHDYKWWIPLTYTTEASPNFTNTWSSLWMRNSSSHTIITDLPGIDHWVIFNLQQTGFYRVNYDERNWDLIIRQLNENHEVINIINRAQIVDDVLNLALAGRLSYNKALRVTQYLKKEKELAVWETAFGNIAHMNGMLANTPAYGGFQEYVLSLLLPLYEQLGFENHPAGPYVQQMTQPELIKWACELGHSHCVLKARDFYKQWMDDPKHAHTVPYDMEHIYCTAIASGGLEEWKFAWKQYQVTDIDKHKDSLITALSCNKETWIKIRYLKMAFTPGVGIRNYDTYMIFESVASQIGDRNTAWEFLRQDWPSVPLLFGRNYDIIEGVIMAVTKNFNTEMELKELESFRNDHEGDEMVQKATAKAIKQTSDNIAWMERNYDVISRWLDEQGFTTMLKL